MIITWCYIGKIMKDDVFRYVTLWTLPFTIWLCTRAV